ncbi:hypothetical protein [Pseudopedobacter beijingensis]|uniref:Uncharacterized protein n=1 Tax=Pseudopedobacter beijingensis TaxID=1207056 RepID=A0ABW4IGR9_9SPHI
MRKDRIITNYGKYNDVQLDFKAKLIVENLTDNANFPTTTPPVEDLATLSNSYSIALNKAKTGERSQIANKNAIRKLLLNLLQELAVNIESQAFNDKSRLISSGFDVSSNTGSSPQISPPKNFKVLDGANSGEIRLTCTGATNALSYVHEYTEDELTENTVWKSEASSSRNHVFRNIVSGRRVYARTKAIGSKGQEISSNTLSRIVQ